MTYSGVICLKSTLRVSVTLCMYTIHMQCKQWCVRPQICHFIFVFYLFVFDIGSHVSQDSLEPAM